MVMPLAGRVVAAVAGGLLVLAAVASVTVTLIVSRPVKSRLTRWVDRMVDWAYKQVVGRVTDYQRRDQMRATQAAALLLAQLAAWLHRGVRRVRPAVVAVRNPRRGVGLHRRRVLAVHPRLRRASRDGAGGDRFPGRGDRAGDPRAADRLLADPVRGVQPPGDSGGSAQRAGRDAVVGPGTAGAHPLRAGNRGIDSGYAAGSVRAVGKLGRRRRGEPHHLPGAGAVPLTGSAVVLGDRVAGRAGLRRAVPGLSPGPRRWSRPGCACAAGSGASTGSPGQWASTSPTSPARTPGPA